MQARPVVQMRAGASTRSLARSPFVVGGVATPVVVIEGRRVNQRSSRRSAVQVRAQSGDKSKAPLPWQAAMSEIKKRRDIKSIMSEFCGDNVKVAGWM